MLAEVDLQVIGDVVDELKNKVGCFRQQPEWTVKIYWHGKYATISQDKNGLRRYEIEDGLLTITIDDTASTMTQLGRDFSVSVKGDFVEEGSTLPSVMGLFVVMVAVLAAMRCLIDVYAPIKECVRESLKQLLVQTSWVTPAFDYGITTYSIVCEDLFNLADYEKEDEAYMIRSVTEANYRRLQDLVESIKKEGEGT